MDNNLKYIGIIFLILIVYLLVNFIVFTFICKDGTTYHADTCSMSQECSGDCFLL